jgi:serine/threonine protein kinase
MAPEMLNFSPQNYSSKVDIWALGVMAHEILTGVVVFPGINPAAVRQNILKMTSYLGKRNESKNQIVMINDNIA